MDIKERDFVLALIDKYEGIIHGRMDKFGLFDCYDSYYAGLWDEDLKEIEEMKKSINL